MEWVYQHPFTKREQKAYDVLKKRLKNADLAKETIKVLSLAIFLRKKVFNSAKEVKQSAFYDNAKTKPIFTDETAKVVFKGLKKKGGEDIQIPTNVQNGNYPFTTWLINKVVYKAVNIIPEIGEPITNIYGMLTTPVMTAKESLPLVDLGFSLFHTGAETAITSVGDLAGAVGGAPGELAGLVITGLIGVFASTVALVEKDTGQAIAYVVNVIPVFGSALGKVLTKFEGVIKRVEKHPMLVSYVPFIGEYFVQEVPQPQGEVPAGETPEVIAEGETEKQPETTTTSWKDKLSSYADKAKSLKDKAQSKAQSLKETAQSLKEEAQSLKETAAGPAAAGKRFSTRKHRSNKWLKTRRTKSAKN